MTHFLISLTIGFIELPFLEWATRKVPHYVAVGASFAAGVASLAIALWINGRVG